MSDYERVYYLIESGKAKEVLSQMQLAKKQFDEHLSKLSEKYGCNDSETLSSGGCIVGLCFVAAQPDKKLWREVSGWTDYYFPRRNTKKGKEIAAEINAVKRVSSLWLAENFLGNRGALIGCKFVSAGLEKLGDNFVIITGKSEEWKPIEGLRELKNSEYWLMKEAHAGGEE